MTDVANTVEEQLRELKSQFQHACNIIEDLTIINKMHECNAERQDRLINEQRQIIVSLECKQCRCGDDDCSPKLAYWQKG